MFGDSMLVSPKIGPPAQLSAVMNGIYNQSVYLPPAADWYFYNTKSLMPKSSSTQYILIGDDEFGTFVKAGAVLPILNYELGRMSILQAIDDPIRLEVYPDASNTASGNLYLDDGMSNQYKTGAQTYVTYTFNGTVLNVTKSIQNGNYFKASNKMIDEIVILNVTACPTAVLNTWVNNTPEPAQGNVSALFVYLPTTLELHIIDLNIPVDDGLTFGEPQGIIQIIY